MSERNGKVLFILPFNHPSCTKFRLLPFQLQYTIHFAPVKLHLILSKENSYTELHRVKSCAKMAQRACHSN